MAGVGGYTRHATVPPRGSIPCVALLARMSGRFTVPHTREPQNHPPGKEERNLKKPPAQHRHICKYTISKCRPPRTVPTYKQEQISGRNSKFTNPSIRYVRSKEPSRKPPIARPQRNTTQHRVCPEHFSCQKGGGQFASSLYYPFHRIASHPSAPLIHSCEKKETKRRRHSVQREKRRRKNRSRLS